MTLNSYSQTTWHLEKADEGKFSSNAFIKIYPNGTGDFIVEGSSLPVKWFCTPKHLIFQDTLTKIYYVTKVTKLGLDKMILSVDDHKLTYTMIKEEN